MPDYEKMYFQLAARVADVVEVLIAAQQQGEDMYIESSDELVISAIQNSDEKIPLV